MNKVQKLQDIKFHSLGYGHVFSERVKSIKWKINILTFLSFACPVLFASVVGLVGKDWKYYEHIRVSVGGIAIIQLIISVWAYVSNWQEEYYFSKELKRQNNKLCHEINAISPENISDEILGNIGTKYAVLQSQIDDQNVTENEKRIGYRYSCYMIKTPCSICGKIPKNMNGKEECETCSSDKE